MRTEIIQVGILSVNCGIVYDEESRKGVVIDPGAQAEKILAAIQEAGAAPEAILLTHGHFDHIMAALKVRERYEVPIFIGARDEALLEDPVKNQAAVYMRRQFSMEADQQLHDGDLLPYLSGIRVLHVPGHTPGSVCFYFEKEGLLFAGDTLFAGSIGRTDTRELEEQLIRGIREKLLTLPDDTRVIPGHGNPTGIGREKRYNPFLV